MSERRFCRNQAVRLEQRDEHDTPTIVGYAAVYYDGTRETEYLLWGEVRERIMPGAFDKTMGDGDDVRALKNHDPNQLLGRLSADTLTLKSDDTGLRYDIDVPDTQVGRDTVVEIKRRDMTGSSFAFVVTDEVWRKEEGVEIREIRGVQLFDVGPVTFPAYDATTTGVRADGALDEARESHAWWQAAEVARAARIRGYRVRAVEVGL